MSGRLTRRRFLRGAVGGAAFTLGLPIFDALLDGSGTAWADGGALPVRFGTWFWGCGMNPARWNPTEVGSHFELPIELAPVAPIREHLNILTGFSVLLDGRQRVMREDLISEGILTASLVHPREVFAPAIREAASSLLLVHNHPSGDPSPSREDREITARLRGVGEMVGIPVLDHVVVAEDGFRSFADMGLL